MLLKISFTSILLLFCSCSYLLKQGVILISDQIRAEPIEKLKKRKNISIEEEKFFNEIEKIRNFAFDTIGLIRNKNYTRFIKIERDYLVAVLCAAEPLSFTVKKWCYPFMGCFPLRGYYNLKDAEKEAKKLVKKGYEVNIDQVDGFSTLGIFSDPVYSFMKKYPIFFLANYIFHEQTHATVYFKDVQFSEELATFIGREGALRYLKNRFGEESVEYINAKQYIQDEETYLTLLRGLYKKLDTLYKSNKSIEEKLELKNKIISEFKLFLKEKYDSLFLTKWYRGIENNSFNNAFLAVRRTYTLDLDLFKKLYEKENGNLKKMINFTIKLKKEKNPKEKLKEYLNL